MQRPCPACGSSHRSALANVFMWRRGPGLPGFRKNLDSHAVFPFLNVGISFKILKIPHIPREEERDAHTERLTDREREATKNPENRTTTTNFRNSS